MEVKIRETKETDFEEISNLLKDTGLKDEYFTKEKFDKMLERNKAYCYVAEYNRKIIGSAFAMHDGAFRGYIQKIAVSRGYRRNGVAKSLIKTIIDKLEEIEIPLIFALTEKNNKPSVELLESLGFEVRYSHYLIDKGYKKRK